MRIWIPFTACLLNGISQVVWVRFHPSGGLLQSVFAGFALGAAFLAAAEAISWILYPLSLNETIGFITADMLIFFCVGYAYFHCINMTETARRIRILTELYFAGGRLPKVQLAQRYNAAEIVNKRLARLIGKGQIVLHNGHYHIQSPFLAMTDRGLIILKMLLFKQKSEHDGN